MAGASLIPYQHVEPLKQLFTLAKTLNRKNLRKLIVVVKTAKTANSTILLKRSNYGHNYACTTR